MTDEFDIVPTGSEDHFYRDEQDIQVSDFIAGIDNVLHEIEVTGDMSIGLNVAKSIVSSVMAHGKSLAKLFYGMDLLWNSDSDFLQYVAEFTGLQPITVSRYVDAWAAYLTIPAEYQPTFLTRPMKDLNAIGAAVAQGFEITDWGKLSAAPNNAALLKIIREDVKSAPARKNSILLYIQPTGDIVAWNNDKVYNVGYLNLQDKSPATQKAITRIIDSAGIIRQD
jgi:hypothetical protein